MNILSLVIFNYLIIATISVIMNRKYFFCDQNTMGILYHEQITVVRLHKKAKELLKKNPTKIELVSVVTALEMVIEDLKKDQSHHQKLVERHGLFIYAVVYKCYCAYEYGLKWPLVLFRFIKSKIRKDQISKLLKNG